MLEGAHAVLINKCVLTRRQWNTPSLAFYESLGAKPQDIWENIRLDGDALKALEHLESRPRRAR